MPLPILSPQSAQPWHGACTCHLRQPQGMYFTYCSLIAMAQASHFLPHVPGKVLFLLLYLGLFPVPEPIHASMPWETLRHTSARPPHLHSLSALIWHISFPEQTTGSWMRILTVYDGEWPCLAYTWSRTFPSPSSTSPSTCFVLSHFIRVA